MPPFYELSIASFRQPSSSKLRWAFVVVFTPASGHSLVYQIVGSSSRYSMDVPQSVTLKEGDNGYMGKIPIGIVDSEQLHQLHSALTSVRIDNGNPMWNSRDWVMGGIAELRRREIYNIDKQATAQWVSERLGEK